MSDSPHNSTDVRDFYLSLSDREKEIFLAMLSNSLTIDGRDFFLTRSGKQLVKSLEGLNELQHQISQHIGALILGSKRYPDEVLWNILVEKAQVHGIAAALGRSLRSVRSRSVWPARKGSSETGSDN